MKTQKTLLNAVALSLLVVVVAPAFAEGDVQTPAAEAVINAVKGAAEAVITPAVDAVKDVVKDTPKTEVAKTLWNSIKDRASSAYATAQEYGYKALSLAATPANYMLNKSVEGFDKVCSTKLAERLATFKKEHSNIATTVECTTGAATAAVGTYALVKAGKWAYNKVMGQPAVVEQKKSEGKGKNKKVVQAVVAQQPVAPVASVAPVAPVAAVDHVARKAELIIVIAERTNGTRNDFGSFGSFNEFVAARKLYNV